MTKLVYFSLKCRFTVFFNVFFNALNYLKTDTPQIAVFPGYTCENKCVAPPRLTNTAQGRQEIS